jgi:hypothetical protein
MDYFVFNIFKQTFIISELDLEWFLFIFVPIPLPENIVTQ